MNARLEEGWKTLAIDAIDAMTYDWDVRTGAVRRSKRQFEILGIAPHEETNVFGWWLARVHPDDRLTLMDELHRVRRERIERVRVKYRIRHENGCYRWVLDQGLLIFDSRDEIVRIVGCVSDIDVEESRFELLDHLKEENSRLKIAVRESHHRVKNHLQALASLAELPNGRGEAVTEADLRRVSQHAQTLALLHDIMTERDYGSNESVDSSKRIMDRLGQLFQAIAVGRPLRCECADFPLTPRQSSALALVLGELVSNCLKHGRGAIRISLKPSGDQAALVVVDRGKGFCKDFDADASAHLGIQLLTHIVAHDLKGQVQFGSRKRNSSGVLVRFPILEFSAVANA